MSGLSRRGPAVLLAVLLLFGASPLLAQGRSSVGVQSHGEPPARVLDELEAVATRFAQALGQGNAEAMARLMADGAIRLRISGVDRSALSARQAQAALREFLRGYEPGQVRLVRAAPVVGTPGRGFAELRWQTRMAGTSQPAFHSVFLGLVDTGSGWRVDELRLLP